MARKRLESRASVLFIFMPSQCPDQGLTHRGWLSVSHIELSYHKKWSFFLTQISLACIPGCPCPHLPGLGTMGEFRVNVGRAFIWAPPEMDRAAVEVCQAKLDTGT